MGTGTYSHGVPLFSNSHTGISPVPGFGVPMSCAECDNDADINFVVKEVVSEIKSPFTSSYNIYFCSKKCKNIYRLKE